MSENYNTNDLKYTTEQKSSVSISEIWTFLWERKWWYLVSLIICCCFAVFYLYKTPKQYTRVLKVMVDESTQDAALRNLGVASAGMYRMRSTNSIENEVEAFASPDLMEEVVERLGLQTSYYEQQFARKVELYRNSPVEMHLAGDNMPSGFSLSIENLGENRISVSDFNFNGIKDKTVVEGVLGDTLVTPVGKLLFYPTTRIDEFESPIRISWTTTKNAAKIYESRLNVSLTENESSVIALRMTECYPNRSELVLSTLLDVYNEAWVRNKNRASVATTAFINERLVIIENELSVVEQSLKDYKESNNLTDLEAVAKVQIQESTKYAAKSFEVANQLSVAQYIKEYLNAPTNEFSLIPSNVGLDKASSSVDSQIKQYNDLLLQRERLLAGSSLSNPLVQDITSSSQAMRSAILRSIDNLIATLEMQKERLDSEERTLTSQMTSSTGQAFELLSIEREQKIKQQLYVFLLQKREENELAALVNVGNTRLIMNPNGSNKPVAPQTAMILLVAILLGFGIPFFITFIIKISDTKIRSREDLKRMPMPFLAEIPHYGKKDNWFKRHFSRHKEGENEQYGIVVEAGQRDMINEAFRVLRTNTDMMLGLKGNQAKVVMFTSFLPSSGKSVTIKNLAASMALKDAKVLLVDLDLRKASLSKSLNLNHSGVVSYLNGKSHVYSELCDEVQKNLFVLPVGSLPPNPSELLLSERFKQLIDDAKKDFDYIFLDCPPVGFVVDARIITEFVDMTVFMLRADQVGKEVLPILNDFYANNTYKHIAVILNDIHLQYQKYGYGKGGYGYGYGYGN